MRSLQTRAESKASQFALSSSLPTFAPRSTRPAALRASLSNPTRTSVVFGTRLTLLGDQNLYRRGAVVAVRGSSSVAAVVADGGDDDDGTKKSGATHRRRRKRRRKKNTTKPIIEQQQIPSPPGAMSPVPMQVVFVATEVAPWSKVGGLGDVMAALPAALASR